MRIIYKKNGENVRSQGLNLRHLSFPYTDWSSNQLSQLLEKIVLNWEYNQSNPYKWSFLLFLLSWDSHLFSYLNYRFHYYNSIPVLDSLITIHWKEIRIPQKFKIILEVAPKTYFRACDTNLIDLICEMHLQNSRVIWISKFRGLQV